MITEWFIESGLGMAGWFFDLLPEDFGIQPYVVTATNGFVTFMDAAGQLGAWFPWDFLALCAAVVVPTYFVLFGLKGLRWLWGIFTGGS